MTDALPAAPSLLDVLATRRSVDADFLGAPGPTPAQTGTLLRIAARVPDHGMLEPWRFILFEGAARAEAGVRLAAAYEAALAAGMSVDSPEKAERTRARLPKIFDRAPLVVAVVCRADPAARKPEFEQVLSVGAACMNLVAAATAMGFGAIWLTGWAAYDPRAHAVLGVAAGEKVAGFIHIGTTQRASPERRRPDLAAITTRWTA
jgi:nitroreductase